MECRGISPEKLQDMRSGSPLHCELMNSSMTIDSDGVQGNKS
jgi:hypothetical protein